MIHNLLLLLLLPSALLAEPISGEPGPEKAHHTLRRLAVMVTVSDGDDSESSACGTATRLEGGRWIATNKHVIGEDGDIRLEDFEGVYDMERAQVESQWIDVAVFPQVGRQIREQESLVSFEDLEPGAELYSLGNMNCMPWTFNMARLQGRFVPGQSVIGREFDRALSEINPDTRSNRRLYVSSRLGGPGNSGGPVVDGYGRLAAIQFMGTASQSILIPIEEVYAARNLPWPGTTPIEGNEVESSETGEDVAAVAGEDDTGDGATEESDGEEPAEPTPTPTATPTPHPAKLHTAFEYALVQLPTGTAVADRAETLRLAGVRPLVLRIEAFPPGGLGVFMLEYGRPLRRARVLSSPQFARDDDAVAFPTEGGSGYLVIPWTTYDPTPEYFHGERRDGAVVTLRPKGFQESSASP